VGLKKILHMFAVFFFMFIFVSIAWVQGIDNMKKNHPDYKGEDFLHWDKMKKYEDDLYK
jgi:drug/metabolite transporter superfamily protein YnfA